LIRLPPERPQEIAMTRHSRNRRIDRSGAPLHDASAQDDWPAAVRLSRPFEPIAPRFSLVERLHGMSVMRPPARTGVND
jgi:hypothetical protein